MPRWNLDQAVEQTVDWYRRANGGATARELLDLTLSQIADYTRSDTDGTGR
jgi:hypothetical protein